MCARIFSAVVRSEASKSAWNM